MKRPGLLWLVTMPLGVYACTPRQEDEKDRPAAREAASETVQSDGPAKLGKPAPPEAEESVTEAGATKRIAVHEGDPPVIELIDAGAEPREPLRLDPPEDLADSFDMELRMKIGMQMGTNAMPPIDTPPIVMTSTVELDAIEGDQLFVSNDVDSVRVLERPGSPAAMLDAMKEAMTGMENFSADTVVSRRGVLLEGTVDVPQDLPAQMQQTLDQMIDNLGRIQVPFPEEPIGLGATWTASSTMDQSGMELRQVVTYELVARDGNVLDLELALKQALASTEFDPPGLPPGAQVDIGRFESTGNGKLKLDLTRLTPISGETRLDMDLEMDVAVMGDKQAMKMSMGLDMKVSTKP